MLIQKQNVEIVPIRSITAAAYQRDLDMHRVERIVRGFDVAKLNMPVVSAHADGSYTILDGQHRIAALREMNEEYVRCIILKGLTLEQEADYFRTQDVNCRALQAIDRYKAGLVAKDPHYIAIEEILKKYSMRVGHDNGPRSIAAVDALSHVALMYSFPVLDKVLGAVTQTWPTDGVAVRREMLAGMSEFMSRFGGKVTPEMFGKRMSGHHPSQILYDYHTRMGGRVSPRSAFCRANRCVLCAVIMEYYNKGLNKKIRLSMTEECEND